ARSTSVEQRREGAFALGLLGGSAAVRELNRLVDDKEPRVRTAAAIALGGVAPERSTELMRRAHGEDAIVQWGIVAGVRIRHVPVALAQLEATRAEFARQPELQEQIVAALRGNGVANH